jgi:hypothetical protein
VAVTYSDVQALATETATLSTTVITANIARAALRVNTTRWGGKADLAITLLAAHYCYVYTQQGATPAGPATQTGVGSNGRGVSTGMNIDALDASVWGREFKSMRAEILGADVL